MRPQRRPASVADAALEALYWRPALTGVVAVESGALSFGDLLSAARELWGARRVRIVPHSAERVEPVERGCFLLPNAQLHPPHLLQAVFRTQEGASEAVWIACCDPSDALPAPILLDRAFARIESPLEARPRSQATRPSYAAEPIEADALERIARAAAERELSGHRAERYAAEYYRFLRACQPWAGENDRDLLTVAIEAVMDWRANRLSEEARPPDLTLSTPADAKSHRLERSGGSAEDPKSGISGNGESKSDGNPADALDEALDGSADAAPRKSARRTVVEPDRADLPPGWSWSNLPTRARAFRPGQKSPASLAARPRSAPRSMQTPTHGGPFWIVQHRPSDAAIDWNATLLAAAPWRKVRLARGQAPVMLGDVRYRLRRGRNGLLHIVLCDTSASMLQHKMAKAKALCLALADALEPTSWAALIECGGPEASIAVWPTRSAAKLKAGIRRMATGGPTPLAGALGHAARLARRFDPHGNGQVRLVVISDGGANLVDRPKTKAPGTTDVQGPGDRLRFHAAALKRLGVSMLWVDTRGPFSAGGMGLDAAMILGAAYAPLSALESVPSV